MKLKSLGSTFALNYVASRLAGRDERTSLRRAGVGTITEQVFDPTIANGITEAVEVLAMSDMLEQQLDRPVELSTATTFRPTMHQVEQSKEAAEKLFTASQEDLYKIDEELRQHELGIVETRQFIRRLRFQNLEK
jgi:hypothetical protein